MSGELTARPKGSTRHPWDWYVEEKWVTHRLLDMIALESDVTYLDPCCGQLHIPEALTEPAFGRLQNHRVSENLLRKPLCAGAGFCARHFQPSP